MCTGANATGTCDHQVWDLKTCHDLDEPFFENINTFAPDGEDFHCFPRLTACDEICKSPTGCTFGAVDFNYEHKYNLSSIGWDKWFRSFDCVLKPSSSGSPPPSTVTGSPPPAPTVTGPVVTPFITKAKLLV